MLYSREKIRVTIYVKYIIPTASYVSACNISKYSRRCNALQLEAGAPGDEDFNGNKVAGQPPPFNPGVPWVVVAGHLIAGKIIENWKEKK